MKFLIALSLLLSFPVFAQDSEIERDITEGKIQAAEADSLKIAQRSVDQKLQQATLLIQKVAEISNQRASVGSDDFREEAEYAHSGFIARIFDIKEDQEALARKEIQPDLATLKKDESRLDKLISDINAFLVK